VDHAPPTPSNINMILGVQGWNLLTQAGLPCLMECEAMGVEVHAAVCATTAARSLPHRRLLAGTYIS
jgi:hypothetical protein